MASFPRRDMTLTSPGDGPVRTQPLPVAPMGAPLPSRPCGGRGKLEPFCPLHLIPCRSRPRPMFSLRSPDHGLGEPGLGGSSTGSTRSATGGPPGFPTMRPTGFVVGLVRSVPAGLLWRSLLVFRRGCAVICLQVQWRSSEGPADIQWRSSEGPATARTNARNHPKKSSEGPVRVQCGSSEGPARVPYVRAILFWKTET